MTIDRAALRQLIVSSAKPGGAAPLADLFLADVEPLLAAVESGSLPLVDGESLDAGALADALAVATGETETHFVLDISSADEPLADEYQLPEGYHCTLPRALTEFRRRAFNDAHGREPMDAIIEPLYRLIGERYSAAVAASVPRFFKEADFRLAMQVVHGGPVALCYAAAYAAMGDARQYEQLRPLLAALTRSVPVGIPADEKSLWLTLVK